MREGCVKTSQETGFRRNTLSPVKVTVFQKKKKKGSIKSSEKGSLMVLGTETVCPACTASLSEQLTSEGFGLLSV